MGKKLRFNKLKVSVFLLIILFIFGLFYINFAEILNISKNQQETISSEIYDEETTDEITQEETQAVLAKYDSSTSVYTDNDGNEYVMYEDFGATEDSDCWQAVYDTHVYANTYGYNVTTNLTEIHIYKSDKSTVIPIQTSTDWNGATIYIHDEELDEDFDGDLNGDGSDEVRLNQIFKISSGLSSITITSTDILDNIELDTSDTRSK